MQNLVDVHCHFFNGWYALREAVAIGWNMLRGRYPYAKEIKEESTMDINSLRSREDWSALLRYVARLLNVASQSCADNHDYELSAVSDSNFRSRTELPIITTPLMMDIYFILCDNRHEAAAVGKVEPQGMWISPSQEGREDAFQEFLAAVKKDVQTAALRDASAVGVLSDPSLPGRLDQEMKEISSECLNWGDPKLESPTADLSPGFRKHMTDLEALHRSNPELVLPFLAVDPRRRGILELVKDKIDKGNGPFKGIKLYPPLGYLPSHPDLMPIYAYCAEYDIPITAHASPGGLGNLKNPIYVQGSADPKDNGEINLKERGLTPNEFFADPKRWLPVLESSSELKHAQLRLNLAHFGHDDDWPFGCWTKTIIGILTNPKYPNVYTDISYFTEPSLPDKVLSLISEGPPNSHSMVGERLMFGTDFVMIMLDTKLGGLCAYFNRYSNFPVNLLRDNAQAFLKLRP